MIERLRKFWWGLYPLPKSFWGFFIGGWILCFLVGMVGATILRLTLDPSCDSIFDQCGRSRLVPALLVMAILFNGYPFWAAFGVWRSASIYIAERRRLPFYTWPFWAYAA